MPRTFFETFFWLTLVEKISHRWEPVAHLWWGPSVGRPPHRWLPPVGAVAPSVVAIGGSRRPIGGCHQWEPVAHLWWGPSVGAVAPSVVATSGNYRPIALPHHSTPPSPLPPVPRIPSLRMHVINSYRSRSSALVTKNILDTGVSATSTRHCRSGLGDELRVPLAAGGWLKDAQWALWLE